MDPMNGAGLPGRDHVLRLAERIMVAVSDRAIPVRLMGGVAITLRCPIAQQSGPLARPFSDLDFVVRRSSRDQLAEVLAEQQFAPAIRFNAANGHERLLFETSEGLHADVFVDRFAMCHKLVLKERIRVDERTLPLADLMLTKLQVAEVNRKDVADVVAILHDHDLTADDAGVNIDYITGLLSRDWGWWRTVTANLEIVGTMLPNLALDGASEERARNRLDALVAAVQTTPKSMRWKARAIAGDRVAWREMPEEPRVEIAAPDGTQ
jgi:hypothetical protein